MTPEQRERKKAYLKEWYAKNRERQIAKARAWEAANPERAAQKKREYVERHPDRRKETQRKHYTKPEVLERRRNNPARAAYNRARNDASRQNLDDAYVRRVMAQRMSITGSQIPQALVDAHREVMKIKRFLNEQCT